MSSIQTYGEKLRMKIYSWMKRTSQTFTISIRTMNPFESNLQLKFVLIDLKMNSFHPNSREDGKNMQLNGKSYLMLVVVASISNKNPFSLSCDTHELQPSIDDLDIDTNTSGLICKNERGGIRGVPRKTIGSLSLVNSHVMLTMRSRNAVKSGFFSSILRSLYRVSS